MNHDQLISVLCRTLMHSLWQGAVLSAIIGLVMTFTRNSSAARRYNLLVGAMALFSLAVTATFILEADSTVAPVATAIGTKITIIPGPASVETVSQAANSQISLNEAVRTYLNRYAGWIVSLWFLIVCLRCVQLLTGLKDVRDLRRKDVFRAGSEWEKQLSNFCARLGIHRQVDIYQSARITTPMVIGHLKPLILLPVGMLTSLTAEEAEAILWHELAHIRRADYLVNLLQNLMEIVFFFNPAVLWLSALIKAERENCCDDIALTQSGKTNYLKALVACEEYKQAAPLFAMALKGNTGGLKNRVTRIIYGKNPSLGSREKSVLAACLLALGFFTATLTNAEKVTQLISKVNPVKVIKSTVLQPAVTQAERPSSKPLTSKPTVTQTDTTKAKRKAPVDTIPAVTATPTPAGSSKSITKSTTIVETTTTNTTKPPIAVPAQVAKAAAVAKIADPIKPVNAAAERTNHIISDMISDGIITSSQGLSFKIGTYDFVVNYQKQPETLYQKYRAKYVADQHQGGGDWTWYYNFDKEKYAKVVARHYRDAATAYKVQAGNSYVSYVRFPNNENAKAPEVLVTEELIQDGIITDSKGLSFNISSKEFVVNGKKQPEDIYQKYKAKFVAHPEKLDWAWEHSNP